MKKQMKKLVAAGLALCLILSAVPVSAATVEQSGGEMAAEQSGAVSAAPGTPAVPEVAEEVTVLWEDESLRGEYEKHFLMSDGSYQAEVYAYPVHELVDGVWVELAEPEQMARGDVTAGRETTNILDNFVWEGHGVQSSTGLRLYIGSRSGYTARTYIQFVTMPTIPAGATITAATMKLTMVSGTSLAYNANAYQVTGGEWDPTTIQWTNKPAANILLESNISNNDRTKYQFSVLTAVQHWYDGDPTGQNENYGIMLRYYDETLTGYYNSVYSGDVVDTNSRPKLTISYNLAETADVLVGSSYSLLASSAASAYNWTSEDSSVASVSDTGVVTVHKAGEVKVTASSGNAVWKEYTVYGYIENGVYYIKSATAGLYLGTYGGTAENTLVKLLANATSGDAQMRQLWRIVYLGKGYYSIRPMYKATMGLHASGTNGNAVDIVSIGNKDNLNDMGLINAWGISSGSGGRYNLNHVNTSYLALRPMDGAASPGLGVTTGQDNGSELRYEWDLIRVTGLFVHDSDGELLNLANSIDVEVEMGETCPVSEWPYMITPSNVTITWSTQNADLSVNAQGSIYASKRGEGVVTATATSGNLQYALTVNVTSVETIYVKNYYDSTLEGDTLLLGYIDDAVAFLNDAFKDQFFIKYVSYGNPIRYVNAATDICPNKANCFCQFGECTITNCDDHHKNLNRIGDEAYSWYFDPDCVVVIWTNNEPGIFCKNIGGHTLEDALAATPYDRNASKAKHLPVVEMLTINKFDTSEFDNVASDNIYMSLILAHEIAHTLEMIDVYDTDAAHSGVHSYHCIMNRYNPELAETFYNSIVRGATSALCEGCVQMLNEDLLDDVYES